MTPCSRDGFGLPAVLAVLAVSAVAALGALRVGLQRALDARDAIRLVRAQSAAESAVRAALAWWDADSMRAVPPGATVSLAPAAGSLFGGVAYSATAERAGLNRFLVRGEASLAAAGANAAIASAIALIAMIPTDEIWMDFHSALASGGDVTLTAGAIVSGTDSGVPPGWSPADCPPGLAAMVAALFGTPDRPGVAIPATGASLTATGATLSGLPPLLTGAPATDTADFVRLGPLPFSDVAVIADRVEVGTVNLVPSTIAGSCDIRAPGNWGAPADPTHPCFRFVPVVHAPADLEIASGTGQAVLVVDGDLTLRAGVSFTGLILVRGRIDLDGAAVIGAVRAGEGARVAGALRYSGCAVGRTLQRARALGRPYRTGDRFWLPAF